MHHTGDRLQLSNNLEARHAGLFGNPHEKLISHSIKLCNFASISLNSCPSKLDQSINFNSVTTDFKEKVKHYKAGFSEYKRLLKEFPRRHNRLTENTTLKKKEFKFHLDEYVRLMRIMKK